MQSNIIPIVIIYFIILYEMEQTKAIYSIDTSVACHSPALGRSQSHHSVYSIKFSSKSHAQKLL